MEVYGIIALALAGFGFAGVATALGVRIGSLRATISSLASKLTDSEKERDETRKEFESYQDRAHSQLEKLRDDLTDMEDMLAACTDPAVIHEQFDRVLLEAAGGLSRSDSD